MTPKDHYQDHETLQKEGGRKTMSSPKYQNTLGNEMLLNIFLMLYPSFEFGRCAHTDTSYVGLSKHCSLLAPE